MNGPLTAKGSLNLNTDCILQHNTPRLLDLQPSQLEMAAVK